MKRFISFHSLPGRNRCNHGQKKLTHWWQFDWLVCRLMCGAGYRFWLYTWWGNFFVDVCLTSFKR